MLFFIDLPHDLFKSITEEYLQIDVHQLSCLDVAHCNRKQRSDLLALMRGTRASYPRKRIAGGALAGYLQWMISRAVHVSRLEIGLAAFQDSRLSSLGPLPGVETVEIIDERLPAKDADTAASNVVQFLNQFPVLGMLRVWQSMDAQSLQLLTCRLEGLDILPRNSLRLYFPGVSSLLGAIGHHLQVLRCESQDFKVLPAIAEHCHCLNTLDLHLYNAIPPAYLLEQICTGNASTLKTLLLHATNLSQTTLLQVVSSCPNLEHFQTTSTEIEPIPLLEFIFAHCLKLKEVELPQVTVAKSTTDRQLMEIKKQCWYQHSSLFIADQIALLGVVDIPLCAYQVQYPDETTARPVLQYLRHRFGLTMTALDLYLGHMAIDGDSVRDLLLQCPNLTEFKINPWSNVMSVLPSACRKITTIECGGNNGDFSDLLANFKALPDNCVTEFVFPYNVAMNAELLTAVAEAFPRLHLFSVVDGRTDKVALLNLILSGKLKAKRITVFWETAGWIAEKLAEQNRKHRQDINCIVLPV